LLQVVDRQFGQTEILIPQIPVDTGLPIDKNTDWASGRTTNPDH
jgi:hypothetical protein